MSTPLRRAVRSAVGRAGFGRAVEGFELQDAACLTYDDGPDPVGTTAVLEELRAARATATFFVMANRVRRHPGMLEEIAGEGHEVALHGPDHRDLGTVAPHRVRTLVRDARAEVEDSLGAAVRWFRPPYLALRADGWLALRGSGLRFVTCGSEIPDWRPELSDQERIAHLTGTLSPGDVVEAHDGWADVSDHAYPGEEPRVDRGRLCAEALELFEARGLRPMTLSAAAARARPSMAISVAFRPTGPTS